MLSSKSKNEVWIEPIVDKFKKTIYYRIRQGGSKTQIDAARLGTKVGHGAHFRCLLSGTAIPPKYVKSVGQERKMGYKLIALIAKHKGKRVYIEPSIHHESAARSVTPEFRPDTTISGSTQYIGVRPYGVNRFDQLHSDRQLVALGVFKDLISEVRSRINDDARKAGHLSDSRGLKSGGCGADAYAEAVSLYLTFALGRAASYWNTGTIWEPSGGFICNVFTLHAIPMVWDFAEGNPFSTGTGSWMKSCLDWIHLYLRSAHLASSCDSKIIQADARSAPIPQGSVISTDPPYYDNIPYADISDFFYCWMRPVLREMWPDIFGVLATPKADELVAAPHRQGGREAANRFFLEGMKTVIKNMVDRSSEMYPTTIYYAFKQSEVIEEGVSSTGWAVFLQGVVDAGYAIVRTWPVRTERSSRMRAHDSNALASSVVLVCRKRDGNAKSLSIAEFIRALRRELPPAISAFQDANIGPADMPQAAIGPGMSVFSSCKAVLQSDDTPLPVRSALRLINRELDEYLSGIQGEFDSATRFALTWFTQHGFKDSEFGLAESIASARGISVEQVRRAGIVEASAGRVRILKRQELDQHWEPSSNSDRTIWQCAQYLALALQNDGEDGAATLLGKIGPSHGSSAKELAYCLYDIAANKRSDAAEATTWNGLIAAWPDFSRRVGYSPVDPVEFQGHLDVE